MEDQNDLDINTDVNNASSLSSNNDSLESTKPQPVSTGFNSVGGLEYEPKPQQLPQSQVTEPQPATFVSQSPIAQPSQPVAPSQVSPNASIFNPVSMSPAQKGSGRKWLKIALPILIVVLLLSGGGLYAWYTIMNNRPEKVLADAFTNTVGDMLAKTPTESVGSLTFESKSGEPIKLTVDFDGKTNNKNSLSNLDASLEYGGKTFHLKASAAIFGTDEYYIKVSDIQKTIDTLTKENPDYSTYADMVKPIVEKIDGKWIVITKDDLTKLGESTTDTDVDKCTVAVENLKLSKSDTKKMKKLFEQNQFIIASETLKSEKVKSEPSFHFKLDFNDKAAVNFAKQVIDMPSMATVKKDCDIKPEDFDRNIQNLNDSVNRDDKSNTKPVVELWVGKKTRRPTKFSVTANDKEVSLSFVTQVTLNAKNVVVAKPQDAISVSELQKDIENLMEGSLTNSTNTYSL